MNEYSESFADQSDQETTQDLTRGLLLQQIAEVAFSDNDNDKEEFDRLTSKFDALKPDSSSPVEVVTREAERIEILEYLRLRATKALLEGKVAAFDVAADVYQLMSQSSSDGTGLATKELLNDEIYFLEDAKHEDEEELLYAIEHIENKVEIKKIIGEHATANLIEKPYKNNVNLDKYNMHLEKIVKLEEYNNFE